MRALLKYKVSKTDINGYELTGNRSCVKPWLLEGITDILSVISREAALGTQSRCRFVTCVVILMDWK